MSYLAKELIAKGENDKTHGKGFINKRIKFLLSLPLKRLKIMVTTGKYVDKKSELKFPPYYVRTDDILITSETKLRDIGIGLAGRIIETPGHTIV
ncbi:MAG: hypothetical protein H6Q73_3824 [Firmicutes bacterium]|nr:hypothetical protein [Bacillota bacterium]